MRLIDADALLELVQFRLPIDNHNAEVISGCVSITRRLIENSPTIDAVPVVQCAECKHATAYGEDYNCQFYPKFWFKGDHFCADGERREEKNETHLR